MCQIIYLLQEALLQEARKTPPPSPFANFGIGHGLATSVAASSDGAASFDGAASSEEVETLDFEDDIREIQKELDAKNENWQRRKSLIRQYDEDIKEQKQKAEAIKTAKTAHENQLSDLESQVAS